MENRYEGSPKELKSLLGKSAEFENDARLNSERVKRFQKWDRMRKLRIPCERP